MCIFPERSSITFIRNPENCPTKQDKEPMIDCILVKNTPSPPEKVWTLSHPVRLPKCRMRFCGRDPTLSLFFIQIWILIETCLEFSLIWRNKYWARWSKLICAQHSKLQQKLCPSGPLSFTKMLQFNEWNIYLTDSRRNQISIWFAFYWVFTVYQALPHTHSILYPPCDFNGVICTETRKGDKGLEPSINQTELLIQIWVWKRHAGNSQKGRAHTSPLLNVNNVNVSIRAATWHV